MSEWELEPILHDYWGKYPIPCSSSDDLQRWLLGYSADLIQKYQAHLTSQCGPEPCKTCSSWRTFGEVSRCTWFTLRSQCLNWVEYQGTLSGYAKAMQEMAAHLEAERAKAKAEIEQLRVQLAGCSVAALGSIQEPAKQGDYGWSPSYQDVLELRQKYENVKADFQERPHHTKVRRSGRGRVGEQQVNNKNRSCKGVQMGTEGEATEKLGGTDPILPQMNVTPQEKKPPEPTPIEWNLTDEQAKMLEIITNRRTGLSYMLNLLTDTSTDIVRQEADWWAGVRKALGIPESIKYKLSADYREKKVRKCLGWGPD